MAAQAPSASDDKAAQQQSQNLVTFCGVTEGNIQLVKDINAVLLPVNYSENMYRDMVTCGDVTQLALLHGKCIGAIGCRLQMAEGGTAKLYVLTLGVLAPYRNAGIGSELLRRSLLVCEQDAVIREAELHVQASNVLAVRFYERHGFEVAERIDKYYAQLTDCAAVRLRRRLGMAGVAGASVVDVQSA